jgi:hypothetical protein
MDSVISSSQSNALLVPAISGIISEQMDNGIRLV